MGQDSSIEWTTHTFNCWRGCTKVSAGCANCYADTLSKRNPRVLGVWGPRGTRVVAADAAWREPFKWNRLAEQAGERHRVFCASLADVFEGPETMPAESVAVVAAARMRLFQTIAQTPHLDWLLLTKRPEGVKRRLHEAAETAAGAKIDDVWAGLTIVTRWLNGTPPANVWLGTSVEDQPTADARIPHLLRCPAAVRFLSMEPLLGAVDLTQFITEPPSPALNMLARHYRTPDGAFDPDGNGRPYTRQVIDPSPLQWVIAGGESGPHARPMHPQWARDIRDQCAAAGVPFFYKQWGDWSPFATEARYAARSLMPGCDESIGGDCGGATSYGDIRERDGRLTVSCSRYTASGTEWDRRVEMVRRADHKWGKDNRLDMTYLRLGKHAAGRLLDGRTHDEFPAVGVTRA